MKVLFYDAFDYDRSSFDAAAKRYPSVHIDYLEADLNPMTAVLAKGYDAVCAFVNSDLSTMTIEVLCGSGVKIVLMRCAGFNNVDVDTAKRYGLTVVRVPGYSPEAIAEHAMGLALCSARRIHKGYLRVRENDFGLSGLVGTNLHGKVAGIVGTGRIGASMCRICHGFGMRVLAYDVYHNPSLDFVEYVELDELLEQSDLVSLHCPLTDETHHLIDAAAIARMKPGVIFINTARGGLVETDALIEGIRSGKIGAVGLDVYEEEAGNAFRDRSADILASSPTATFLSFPNVVMTSHQAFLTREALEAIADTSLANAVDFERGNTLAPACVVC